MISNNISITDYEDDWAKFLITKYSDQIDEISVKYPKLKILHINFSDLLTFGEIGKRIAELFLEDPHRAENEANESIKNRRIIKIIRPYTPGDIKISIHDIPHVDLEEICTPDIKQCRSDSRTNAWKGAVKLRDEFRCKNCGDDDDLQVHHIIPVNEDPSLSWDINNGITLCKKCHSRFHSQFGNHCIGHYEIHRFIRSNRGDPQ